MLLSKSEEKELPGKSRVGKVTAHGEDLVPESSKIKKRATVNKCKSQENLDGERRRISRVRREKVVER